MKKLCTLFLLVCCLVQGGLAVSAQTGQEEETAHLENLRFFGGLEIETKLPEKAGESVSRAEFIYSVMCALKADLPEDGTQTVFRDVPEEHFASSAVAAALERGLISYGLYFYPDQPILFEQAVKIAATATGYQLQATQSGGYPAGYLAAAQQAGLLRGADGVMGGTLSAGGASALLCNMLNTDLLQQVTFGEYSSFEVRRGETLLYTLYGIQKVKGVVEANEYLFLSNPGKKTAKGQIIIDGTTYRTGLPTEKLAGRYVEGYVQEQDGELVLLYASTSRNQTAVLRFDEAGQVDETQITRRQEDGKDKRYHLEPGCELIYNNFVRPDALTLEELKDKVGTILLVDNNRDDSYDVVIVEEVQYTLISSVDVQQSVIYDQNDAAHTLDLGADGLRSEILSISDETAVALHELEAGTLLASAMSQDGGFCKIYVCGKSVSGMVSQMDQDEKLLYIEDKAYQTNSYFTQYYAKYAAVGASGNFLLGVQGEIAAVAPQEGGMSYGYLIQMAQDGAVSGRLQAKLFTTEEKAVVLELAKRVKLDGVSVPQSALLQKESLYRNGAAVRQLVRYQTDAEGKLSVIDTAAQKELSGGSVGNHFRNDLPLENSLLQYRFPGLPNGDKAPYFRYKRGLGLFYPSFQVKGAAIFMVPEETPEIDCNDEKNYYLGDTGSFTDDGTYNVDEVQVFDVDESGCAKALVYYTSAGKSKLPGETQSAMVEKCLSEVDAEGNVAKKLYVLAGGQYKSYFLEEAVKAYSDGRDPQPGDIVRYELSQDEQYIVNLAVDFDAEKMQHNTQAYNGISWVSNNSGYNVFNAYIGYSAGKVYSKRNSSIYLSDARQADGSADFSISALQVHGLKPRSVAVFSSRTKAVKTGSEKDIRDYLTAGEEASFVVIRQRYMDYQSMFIYQ